MGDTLVIDAGQPTEAGRIGPNQQCCYSGHVAILTDGDVASRLVPGYASRSSVIVGLVAAVFLVGFYLTVMIVAQGADAAVALLEDDWYLIAPLVIGFGAQIALFARVRQIYGTGKYRSTNAVTGASGSISSLSMLACCTHHLADLLPFFGLSGLALFLGQYREELAALGIISNVAGTTYMARTIARSRRTG